MNERTMGRQLNQRAEKGRHLELVRKEMLQVAQAELHNPDLEAVINEGATTIVALQPEDGTEAHSREPFMQLFELAQEQRAAA